MPSQETFDDVFPDIPDTHTPGANGCLDDRRPRKYSDVVGQQQTIRRLKNLNQTTNLKGQRIAFVGPTGSGKTTLATITARNRYCKHSQVIGDACGRCSLCVKTQIDYQSYQEWTGANLNENWDWWTHHGSIFLERDTNFLFIDEIQDLSEWHQKYLFRDLERARATIVIATTHENKVNDALWGRFGINRFHLLRPTEEDAVELMTCKAKELGVNVTREQLKRVVRKYQLNLRICIDFIYSAKDQVENSSVTEEFLESVIGPAEISESAAIPKRARL